MPFSLLALAAVLASAEAAPVDLLQPGLYRLDPEAYLSAPPAIAPPGQAYRQRVEHALPVAAKVRYAYISRDRQAGLNKLVFVTDADDRDDGNPVHRLCQAYAFPGWNARSDAQPFCRTHIGTDGSEAVIEWTATRFTVRWDDQKRATGTEQVPAVRTPTPEEAGICAIADVCAPEAYGRSIQHYEVTHYRDGFALAQARDYQDVLYLPNAIALHAHAGQEGGGTPLAAGSFVAVLARTPSWYRVEQVAADGGSTTGWIDRDALSRPLWVEQAASAPGFRFRLGFERDTQDEARRLLTAIEVLDARTGERVQVLRDFDTEPVLAGESDLLQVVDADADGHPDLLLPAWSGGAGGEGTFNVFVFDPATHRFVFDPARSDP
ncbi:hypothetical protein [Stenotrophomonas nematodicola]|uniref:SH3 domain-containing protein n=1 Tax=Stenotrophomonas nematodicola TaxID=2656746 RepID=A0ABW7CUQ0_9GAMM